MKRVEIVLVSMVSLALVAAAAYGLSIDEESEPEAYAILLIDASLSSDHREACADIERVGRRLIRSAARVHVEILSTGSNASAYEPVSLAKVEVARGRRVLEGKARQREEETKAVETLRSSCELLRRTNESPLLRSLQTAVAHFRTVPCDAPGVICTLVFRTDALDPDVLRTRGARAPRVDNTHVNIELCAIMSRRGGSSGKVPPDLAAVEAAFRPEFTDPVRVTFSPACASFSN